MANKKFQLFFSGSEVTKITSPGNLGMVFVDFEINDNVTRINPGGEWVVTEKMTSMLASYENTPAASPIKGCPVPPCVPLNSSYVEIQNLLPECADLIKEGLSLQQHESIM